MVSLPMIMGNRRGHVLTQKLKYLKFCAEVSLQICGLFSGVGITLIELGTKYL